MVAVARLGAFAACVLLAACAATRGAAHDPLEGGVALVAEGLPAGAQVTVAGSFNGWDPNGPALRETRPGTYETWLPLEPGVHRLQLVVRARGSERWLAPPGLPRYEPDGFGGRNAVVEIARNLQAEGSSMEGK